MQQQQGSPDPIARMQQMAGSSEFQPPRRPAGAHKPLQQDEAGEARRADDEVRPPSQGQG